jgi:spore coat protein U-like protein
MQKQITKIRQKKIKIRCQIIVIAILYFCLQGAMAAETPPQTCTISATSVAFGNYNPFGLSPVDSTGTVTVQCTRNSYVSYSIAMSKGNSGSYSPRKMAHGTSNLNYNLYTDSVHSVVWGDGTSGTSTISKINVRCRKSPYCQHTAYGRIPAGQTTAVPGLYTDSIIVTLTY